MSDLISRQEAIGGICDYAENMSVEYKVFADAAKRMLLNLPSVNCSEKPNNWIPVTERLPEHDGELYMVTDYCEQINRKRIHMSYCYANREGFWSDVFTGYKVIAWMPLPEPYEAETGMQTSIETGMEREKE